MSGRRRFLAATLAGAAILAAGTAFAASEDEAKAMLARAMAAEAEAGKLHNRWTTTEVELKAARKEMAARDFDKALAAATRAEALARQSTAQAHGQDKAWREAVIR